MPGWLWLAWQKVKSKSIPTKLKEVKKGVWGMPRLSEAKKDAISCDKLRGLAHTGRSADFRMGQPAWLKTRHPGASLEANPGN